MGTALASGMAYNAVHGVKMTSDEVSNALKASQEARTAKLDVSPERIANRFSALKKMESFLRANQGRKQDFVRFAFLSMPGQMDSLIESFRVKNGRLPNESEKFTLALNNFRDAIRTGRVSGSTLDSWIKQFSKG
jgi:hypothetical protein